MPKGKIIEFTKERGFGKLELEDGSVVNFDATVATSFEIQPDDVVEVTLKQVGSRKLVVRIDVDD